MNKKNLTPFKKSIICFLTLSFSLAFFAIDYSYAKAQNLRYKNHTVENSRISQKNVWGGYNFEYLSEQVKSLSDSFQEDYGFSSVVNLQHILKYPKTQKEGFLIQKKYGNTINFVIAPIHFVYDRTKSILASLIQIPRSAVASVSSSASSMSSAFSSVKNFVKDLFVGDGKSSTSSSRDSIVNPFRDVDKSKARAFPSESSSSFSKNKTIDKIEESSKNNVVADNNKQAIPKTNKETLELISLINQLDEGNKILSEASDASQALVSKMVSGLEEKFSNLQSVFQRNNLIQARQLDKPASVVTRSDSDISTLTNVSISNPTVTGVLTGASGTFSGNLTIGSQLTVSGTGTSTITGDSNFDSGTFYVDSVNHRVGISTTSPNWKLSVAGIGSFDDFARASYFTATSTTASTFPYASTTAFTVSGNSYLGTVSLGTWNGSSIATQYGGTGQNFSASSGLVNLYSGTASAMATSSLGLLTTDVAEGTNKYWTDIRFDNRLSATTSLQNLTTLANLSITGSQVSNLNTLWDNRMSATTSLQNITTLANLATVGTITSGTWNGTTIAVNKGGTGQTSFGQGWLNSDGTTLSASTSPTVNYIVATSTTKNSTFAGNVGIGTTTPTQALTVNGTLQFSDFGVGVTKSVLSFFGNVNTGFRVKNDTPFNRVYYYAGDGTTLLWASDNTDIFYGKLSYNPNATATFRGKIDNGWGTIGTMTTPLGKLKFTGETDNEGFEISGWDYVSILTSNLGIGTTSPNWKLSVAGIGSFDDFVRASYFTATSTTASTFPYASTTAFTVSGNSYLGTVSLGTWNGSSIATQYGGTGQNFSASSGLVNLYSGTASAMATSSLGLLTTDVAEGTNKYWTDIRFDNRLSATTSLQNITTLANLATLGTITSGTWSGSTIAVNKGGTGQTSFGQGWLNSDGTTISASTSPTVNYIVATSTTKNSTFAGNVGIGTTIPAQKLDIEKGHIRLGQVAAPTAPTVAVNATAGNLNGTYYYRIAFVTALGVTESGTVSASVSPANQQVDLSAIPISSDSAVTSRKIYRTMSGVGAWPYLTQLVTTINDNTTTTYTDNIADGSLGVYAQTYNSTGGIIYNNSTRIGIADNQSTAWGVNALRLNTGYQNTANGLLSLFSNATGSSNTASGAYSLYSNTTGSNNTANGTNSLYSNTTGSNNTASGVSALYSNTTGSSNTANGLQSLYSNTTGNNNTVNGYFALRFNGSATTTTAIGTSAAKGLASYNNQGGVYVGYQSGYSAGTGSDYNTMIGYNSGYGVTTGANNILLGYQAGYSGTNLTTGSNNIIIGYNIGATSTTMTRGLNIGNLIYGIGLDGSGTTLSTGNVGIGTTTPWRTLSVTGSMAVTNLTATAGTGEKSVCIDPTTKEIKASSGTDCTSSSRNFKHNIETLSSGLTELMQLNPVSFIFNSGDNTTHLGFIAEEVNSVDPRLVDFGQDNAPRGVRYAEMTSLLTKSMQELNLKVVDLQASVASSSTKGTDSLFSWIIGKFMAVLGVSFENETVKVKNANVEKLCVGNTCVTEDQLKVMLGNSSQSSSSSSSSSNSAQASSPSSSQTSSTESSSNSSVESPTSSSSISETFSSASSESSPSVSSSESSSSSEQSSFASSASSEASSESSSVSI